MPGGKRKKLYNHRRCVRLWLLQGRRCFYCGCFIAPMPYIAAFEAGKQISKPHSRLSGYTKDHFYPRGRGYRLKDGFVLACRPCNEKKAMRMPTSEEVARYRMIFHKHPIAIALHEEQAEAWRRGKTKLEDVWPRK